MLLGSKTSVKFSHEELLALYKAARFLLDAEPHTSHKEALHSAKDTLTATLNLVEK